MTDPHDTSAQGSADRDSTVTPKAPWHPPSFEEVDYTATEASGVGALYDFVIYTPASH